MNTNLVNSGTQAVNQESLAFDFLFRFHPRRQPTVLGKLHRRFVHSRRVDVLARHFADLIPANANVLDVGSGDGLLAHTILQLRNDIRIEAIDTLLRPKTLVPTTQYDGRVFPHPSNSFDAVLLVDVLHHVDDITVVLREAIRVSKNLILIKDHFVQGFLARPTLLLMDNIGNRQYGVAIPANYWTMEQWADEYAKLHLTVQERRTKLGLYPSPFSYLFERQLHFLDAIRIDDSSPS